MRQGTQIGVGLVKGRRGYGWGVGEGVVMGSSVGLGLGRVGK